MPEQSLYTATLRHELLTPLNQIIGYSELLAEEAENASQARLLPDLQKINQAARSMVQLVDNLFLSGSSATSDEAPTAKHNKLLGPAQTRDNVKETFTGRILVVDDNELNRDMLARRLRREGHTITLAEDGLQAFELLHNTPFDLILLDVMMPGMDGYEVLAKLKKNASLRNLPVIMISAVTEMDSVIKCIELGAEDYLPKPFNPTLLRARVGASLEKKRFREQEQAYREQALNDQATFERHRSLAQMIAGLAHEINTPLGIVNHAASIIAQRINSEAPDAKDDIREASRLIQDGVRRADKLVKTFKNLSASQVSDSKATVSLRALIDECITLYALKARASQLNIRVVDQLAKGDGEWDGYPGHFSQIMLNLLTNADRYAYPEGNGGEVRIVLGSSPSAYLVSVQDFGRGIAAEDLPRIFDPFFTTGRSSGGTGLGMAIVRNLVTSSLQGDIKLDSAPGKGTEVKLTIPRICP